MFVIRGALESLSLEIILARVKYFAEQKSSSEGQVPGSTRTRPKHKKKLDIQRSFDFDSSAVSNTSLSFEQ
jgi:hypothetical protein